MKRIVIPFSDSCAKQKVDVLIIFIQKKIHLVKYIYSNKYYKLTKYNLNRNNEIISAYLYKFIRNKFIFIFNLLRFNISYNHSPLITSCSHITRFMIITLSLINRLEKVDFQSPLDLSYRFTTVFLNIKKRFIFFAMCNPSNLINVENIIRLVSDFKTKISPFYSYAKGIENIINLIIVEFIISYRSFDFFIKKVHVV